MNFREVHCLVSILYIDTHQHSCRTLASLHNVKHLQDTGKQIRTQDNIGSWAGTCILVKMGLVSLGVLCVMYNLQALKQQNILLWEHSLVLRHGAHPFSRWMSALGFLISYSWYSKLWFARVLHAETTHSTSMMLLLYVFMVYLNSCVKWIQARGALICV